MNTAATYCGGSTEVVLSSHHPEVVGLIPPTAFKKYEGKDTDYFSFIAGFRDFCTKLKCLSDQTGKAYQ
jgi:hypothetical protein